MSERIDIVVDFSDPAEKRAILNRMAGFAGKKRLEICDARPRRTDRQNRYYHSAFVRPFADFLRAQGQFIDDGEAHDLIRAKFLRETVFNPMTGNPIGQKIRSTTSLSTTEFNVFLDSVAFWLDEQFGIKVGDPSVYHIKEPEPKKSRKIKSRIVEEDARMSEAAAGCNPSRLLTTNPPSEEVGVMVAHNVGVPSPSVNPSAMEVR